MSNKKIGNGFEAEFCEKMFQNGYWVHNLSQNAAGQPADVVAVKNGVPYLIDCKVCSGKVFSVSRIEDNQRMAMTLWRRKHLHDYSEQTRQHGFKKLAGGAVPTLCADI